MIDELRSDTGTRSRFTSIIRRLLEDPLVFRQYGPIRAESCRISLEALQAMDGERTTDFSAYTKRGLRYEHSVPLAVLVDWLDADVDDRDAMRQTLVDFYRPAWITRAEDDRLKAAGLNSRMPDGWSKRDGPFARYAAVQIQLSPAD